MKRKKKDPNQRGFADALLDEKAKALGEGYKTEYVRSVSQDEASAMNGLLEARWETPQGTFCKTFDIQKDLDTLRPGSTLVFTAKFEVRRRATDPDMHLCDAL